MIELLFVDSTGNLTSKPTDNAYYQSVISFLEKFRNAEYIKVNTSGSTGKPKEISLSKDQIIASVYQTKKAFDLTSADLAICSLPVSYVAGKLMLLRAEILGMRAVVIEPSANPLTNLSESTLAYFRQNTDHLFYAFVPLQLEKIVAIEETTTLLTYAKVILSGGAAIPRSLAKILIENKAPVYETYGMTETVTHVAIRQLSDNNNNASFKFLEGIKHKINSNNCLSIKGLTTKNKWIQTNDIIEYVDEKSFKIVGRLDNVINSGGVKLHPEKIEEKISQLFEQLKIQNAFFCFGKQDSQLGQKLVLFIEGKLSMDLKALLPTKLVKFEIPKEIIFVENFKRTGSNKINRKETALLTS